MWRVYLLVLVLLVPQPISSQQNAKILLDLSIRNNNNPELAKEYAVQAIELANNNKDEITEALTHFQLGYKKQEVEMRNESLEALDLYNMSQYYKAKDDLTKALDYLNQSIAIYRKLDRKKNIANCYNLYGTIYEQLGNYEKSLSYYFKSLRIKEEINDQWGISITLTNIGNLYLLTSKYDDAFRYFSRGIDINRANNNQEGIYANQLRIGVVHQKKGFYDKALSRYKEALAIARKLNYKNDEALLLGNIGSTLRQQGNPKEGLTYLLAALVLKDSNQINRAHLLNDISETYSDLSDFEQAKKYALLAVEFSERESDLNQWRYAYLTLARSYQKLGDYQNAYDALMQFKVAHDSVFSLEKSRQMNELQVKYETEKKGQAINQLTQQKEQAEFRRNSYALLAGLILIVGFLFYYNQRLKTKKNRELLEKGQEVEKMQSRFFTNITHEFRTPLTLILAPIATLAEHISDPKLNQQLHIMKKNGRRMLTLINQLLDLSKLESGNLKLNVTSRNIISIIKGVTMSFQSLAESKQIDLKVVSEAEESILYFDQDKIEKVLSNLLSNAFKFTPTGGCIQVAIQSMTDNKNQKEYLQITVKDTGKGIPQDKVAHIFDRFYQADDSLVRDYEGSGVGLAIAKEFIELHKGTITAISREGQGTEMILRLPVGKEHFIAAGIKVEDQMEEGVSLKRDNALPSINKNEDYDGKNLPDLEKPIVLLIEDNADLRQYTKEILDGNYTILEAADGKSGVEKAFKHIPDLILSDVMMPNLDGYQVCTALKTDEKTSHIPIILLTAKASIESKLEGLQTEADDYLTKPFVPRELLARVQNLIQSRKKLREKFQQKVALKPSEIAINSVDEIFLGRLMKTVEENMGDELFSVEKLGDKIGMSRSQLHRKLNALTGQGPNQLIRSFRLNRAHDLLKLHASTPTEIAYTVGFSSPSYFTKCFREQFGYTPSETQGNSIA